MNERPVTAFALFSLLACASLDPGSHGPSGDAASPEANGPSEIDASTLPIDPFFYEKGDAVCPDGGRIVGAPPPGSTMVYCEKDEKTHGPVAIFDDEGRLTHLATEVNGEYDPVAIDFWPNGRKKKETHYVAGKMQGPEIGWHPDGSKAYEGQNVDDEAEGTFRGFDASGKEVGHYEMRRGNGREVHWHPNGKKAYEVEMVAGREQGLATTWHPNGKKAMEEHYVAERRTGAYEEWDEHGRLRVTGTYDDEQEVGEWTHRDGSGAITRVDRWDDGDLVASIAYQGGRPLAKRSKDGACATEKGLAKAYAAQTGGDLDSGSCIRRSVHFPGVVAIGVFGHDRGCAGGGVMVDCRWHAKPDGGAILERAGWRRANDAAREAMATSYVAEVAETFGGDDPSIARRSDGTLVVGIGMSMGPLMNGETSHWSVEYVITKRGKVTRVESD